MQRRAVRPGDALEEIELDTSKAFERLSGEDFEDARPGVVGDGEREAGWLYLAPLDGVARRVGESNPIVQ